jgi:hypothetical protein
MWFDAPSRRTFPAGHTRGVLIFDCFFIREEEFANRSKLQNEPNLLRKLLSLNKKQRKKLLCHDKPNSSPHESSNLPAPIFAKLNSEATGAYVSLPEKKLLNRSKNLRFLCVYLWLQFPARRTFQDCKLRVNRV